MVLRFETAVADAVGMGAVGSIHRSGYRRARGELVTWAFGKPVRSGPNSIELRMTNFRGGHV
jgi:hypothetical protein